MLSFHPANRMKPRSNPPRGPLVAATVALCFSLAGAQEGTWLFSASGGLQFLRMANVNETLDKTVRDWNQLELVPISPFEHFSSAPCFGFRASYRFERDMVFSLSASFFSASVKNAYNDASVSLSLDRSVGSTQVLIGLGYVFPPLLHDVEASVEIDVGLLFARAEARTFSTRTIKQGASDTTYVYYDSEADYKKSRLIASGGTALLWNIFPPVFLKAEAFYRIAKVGTMEGMVKRIGGTFDEATTTEFDFSALSVTLGLGITF